MTPQIEMCALFSCIGFLARKAHIHFYGYNIDLESHGTNQRSCCGVDLLSHKFHMHCTHPNNQKNACFFSTHLNIAHICVYDKWLKVLRQDDGCIVRLYVNGILIEKQMHAHGCCNPVAQKEFVASENLFLWHDMPFLTLF